MVGRLVAECTAAGITLEQLTLEDLKKASPLFGNDIFDAISLETCMQQRSSYGGPAVSETARQLEVIGNFVTAHRPKHQ